MSHLKCLTINVSLQKSHCKKWVTQNVTLKVCVIQFSIYLTKMSQSKCLTLIVPHKMSHSNVSLQMSHYNCLTLNVSIKMSRFARNEFLRLSKLSRPQKSHSHKMKSASVWKGEEQSEKGLRATIAVSGQTSHGTHCWFHFGKFHFEMTLTHHQMEMVKY